MRHNIVSLKLIYNHGTTEYCGIFSRYLPWSKISGTAQHYCMVIIQIDMCCYSSTYSFVTYAAYTWLMNGNCSTSLSADLYSNLA